MKKNTVSIKDVAIAANVSIATVSRVVNGVGTVNPKLAEKTLQAIQDLNYHPNSAARSLKTQNTSTIAFLVSNISDPFFTMIGRGVEDILKDYNYNLIVCSTDNSEAKELSYLKMVQEKMVDGIILNTTGKNNEYISKLSQTMPMVLSNRRIDLPDFIGDFVDNDNTMGAYDLVSHLISWGHEKIGVINGPLHLSTAKERLNGFHKAMEEFHIPVASDYPYMSDGNFTFRDGYAGAAQLMEASNKPTAIFGTNSELTLGALKYFVENKIKVPDDISIVCFGDIANRELLYVRPTIASTNLNSIGRKAAEMLIQRIQSKNTIVNREACFLTQITYGNSVKKLT